MTRAQRVAAKRARGADEQRELTLSNLRRLKLPAYEVGGSVRSELLGESSPDIDFAVAGMSLEELQQRIGGEGRLVDLLVVTDKFETDEAGEIKLDKRGRKIPLSQKIGYRLTAPWTPADGIEIALAREETSTGDGYNDFKIEPIGPHTYQQLLAEGVTDDEARREIMRRDAKRRDWTVNALMRDIYTGEILDFVGGVEDCQRRRLHPISPDTCRDDPLRTLRGLTRVAKDDLDPSPEAIAQIRENAHRMKALTQNKVYAEMTKLLSGRHCARALQMGADLGVLEHVLPEFAPLIGYEQGNSHHDLTGAEHSFKVLANVVELGGSIELRWAALMHDAGKAEMGWDDPKSGERRFCPRPDAGRFDPDRFSHQQWSVELTDQMFDRMLDVEENFAKKVKLLVGEHMFADDQGFERATATKARSRARAFIRRVGKDNVEDLLLLRRCDRCAKRMDQTVDRIETPFERAVRAEMGCPMHRSELAVTGSDLKQAGLQPGPVFGRVLDRLLDQVIAFEEPEEANQRSGLPWPEIIARAESDDIAAFRALPKIERWTAQAVLAARGNPAA